MIKFKKINKLDKLTHFIDYIYENISIYHALIIYNNNNNTLLELERIVNEKDYPIYKFDNHIINNMINDNNILTILENKFRIFLLEIDILNDYIKLKRNNLETINIIFCLDTYIKTCDILKLNNNIILVDNLYIFSPD